MLHPALISVTLATVAIFAAGQARAQVVSIGAFTGDFSEGFETQVSGQWEACLNGRVFDGTADLCTPGNTGAHISAGWSYYCTVQEHSGSYLFGSGSGYAEYEFDDPAFQFGGYFANHSSSSSMDIEFYDENGVLVDAINESIPNDCVWRWFGWEFQGTPVKYVDVINTTNSGAYILMDDMEVVYDCDETDADGDGHTICAGDCDDNNAGIYPGAVEICDGLDNDCSGAADDAAGIDEDQDGYCVEDGDCDDTDPDINPGAAELCNGLDDDCDGSPASYEYDNDGDEFIECEECDDDDPSVYPGAVEICDDGIDSDCMYDLEETEVDNDNDGYSECGGDCDDADGMVHPDAEEICNGGIDDDCNENTVEDEDMDSDGFTICDGDCDDGNAGIYPGADEACDGVDNDCDGDIDEDMDYDYDGYSGCDGEDCDDYNANIHPGASEVPYNGIDEDCDGEDLDDIDDDGYAGGAYGDDCNDNDPDVHPGMDEICDDGIDGDCDGLTDNYDDDCGDAADDDDDDTVEDGWSSCACTQARANPTAGLWCLGVLGWFIARRRRSNAAL